MQSWKSAQLSGSMSSAVGLAAGEHPGEGDLRADRGAEAGRERLQERRVAPGRLGLDDLVPERAQQLGGVLGGLDARGVDRAVERGLRRDRDAQAAGVRPSPGRRRAGRARGPPGVAELGAGEDVEDLRGLGDRARQHAVDDEEQAAGLGAERDPAALGLEPDEPAAGGRDPDRAAAVVAVRDRHHAGGDRRGGAAGGAARRPRRVPRVARRAEAARLGHRQDPELGQRRRPDEDEARGLQAARRRCGPAARGSRRRGRRRRSAAGPRRRGCS